MITQIGSLPFTSVEEAVAYSLAHSIPFLPELPALGDEMLSYIKEPGKLSCRKEFQRKRFSTVKIQVIGPATLLFTGYEEDDALLRIYTHIERIIDGLCAEEIILFLDEPALGQAGFDYMRLWEVIFSSFQVIRGVHVCGNMQWDMLFSAEIDIISFDASQYDITQYYQSRQGKRIAWGINSSEQIRDFRIGDLITPPCGLSPRAFTVESCQPTLDLLRRTANRLTGCLLV
ncbi:hypothetical protein LM597_01240 [Candidatus Acetothermia bacterium]|nr:hypothetical protein [Candidatus Acetothermia bacterium]MCI2426041.1 hypothetical protein [Candidatus Acetothermia bacterium]MCI2427653.1 hypothetical protein [Candidatus Acetothermia bacterium]